MKRANIILGITALLSLVQFTAPAWATNEYFPTWYVGLRGSLNFLNAEDSGTNPLPDTSADPGFGLGAMAGVALPRAFVQPLGGLRFEAEINRHWHQLNSSGAGNILGRSATDRDYGITSYMANAYYYIPTNTLFTPYIGGGFGKAQIKLDRDPNSTAPASTSENVNAWQAMVGLSFEEAPEALTEWNLGYRYFTADDATFADGFGGQTVMETNIHSIELGMRLRF